MKPCPIPFQFRGSVPKMRIERDGLLIKSALLHQFISLFFYCRVVHVNKAKQQVEIKVKKWWQWGNTTRITFSNIDYVDLTHPELPSSDAGHQNQGPIEMYDVFLMTKRPYRRVDLFRFGSFVVTSPTFEKIAQNYAGLIAEHTGARFGQRKPKDFALAECNDKYFCNNCGHQLPPNIETCWCQYCGSKDIRIE
jgi:ribosomal protein L40E